MATKSVNAKIYQYYTVPATGATKIIPDKMLAGETYERYLLLGNGSTQWQALPRLCGAPPTGTIIEWSGKGTLPGCLNCDGQAVSRTTYAALFAVIGTSYGAGNGSTTFNLPNLVNRTIKGIAGSVGNRNGSTDAYQHTHGVGDIHTIGGAWGGMNDTYGYSATNNADIGTAVYGPIFRYFMDTAKSPGEISHATGCAGNSQAGGAVPKRMKRKLLIKY